MTWTCDYCGAPNFMNHSHCHVCGRPKPARYGRRFVRCRFVRRAGK